MPGRFPAVKNCSKCRAQIRWIWLVTKVGDPKRHPIDAIARSTGNIEIKLGLRGNEWFGRIVPGQDRHGLGLLYVSHFATCPDAESFRGRG